MASNIDPTYPETGNATTQSVRDNFAAAKAEIEELQNMAYSMPIGLAYPATSKTLPIQPAARMKGTNGETFQRFPGVLYAIADALDQAFCDAFPGMAAAVGNQKAFSTTMTATPAAYTAGQVGSVRLGIYTGTPAAYTSNMGWTATDDDWSNYYATTAQTFTGQANTTAPEDVFFGSNVARMTTYSASVCQVRKTTDGANWTTDQALTAAKRYRLAFQSDGLRGVAWADAGNTLGNIWNYQSAIGWQTGPNGSGIPSRPCLFCYWSAHPYSGSPSAPGYFVGLDTTYATRTIDGTYNNDATAHGITVPNVPGVVEQTRVAWSANCTMIALTNGLYRTTNHQTFTKILPDNIVWMDYATDRFRAITEDGTIMESTDDGLTWNAITARLHETIGGEQTNGRSLIVGARYLSAAGKLSAGFKGRGATTPPNVMSHYPNPPAATHVGTYRDTTTTDTVTSFVRIK